MKIAVIMFPGNNCEEETARAIESVGMEAKVVRWNDTTGLSNYDGYVLPGGWAYEDRIRAGVIPAQDPIMDIIKQEASKGKVVLGICNGAQVLVESGIIPGLKNKVQMALAPNINPLVSGFYCSWVKIKNASKKKTAFNLKMYDDEVIDIPIANAEGRFATKDQRLIMELVANEQLIFRYCDEMGNIKDKFPTNPNGSLIGIAGICNKKGNVMAMMPHPERSAWMRQVPELHYKGGKPGPGSKIFESIKEYLE